MAGGGGGAVENSGGGSITKKGKGGRKAANPSMSDEQRRQERVLKNRVSAMKSLQKKKRYTDDLEKRAKLLTAQNIDLKTRIYALVAKLAQSGVNVGFGGGTYDPLLQALLAQHNHAYSSYGVPPHMAAAAAAAHHQALVDSQHKQAMAAAAAAQAQQVAPSQCQQNQPQLPHPQLPVTHNQLQRAGGQLQSTQVQQQHSPLPQPQVTASQQPAHEASQSSPNAGPSTNCTPVTASSTPAAQNAPSTVDAPVNASVSLSNASQSDAAQTAAPPPEQRPLVVKSEEQVSLVKPEQCVVAPLHALANDAQAAPTPGSTDAILEGDALEAFSDAVLEGIDIDMGGSFLNVDPPDLSLLDDVEFTPTPQF